MAQIFQPHHNSIARVSIIVVLMLVAGTLFALDIVHKSPYVRYTKQARQQPVPFSHKHHANMGIDCRYCHVSVEDAAFATVPPTRTCMNCHSQIFADEPILEPVRESWETGKPLEWVRVNDLPDHVYFNHAVHVNKGIGCTTCHGQVNEMPLTWREHPLLMKWCTDCHRNPEQQIRPKDEVFNMAYTAPHDQAELGAELVDEYHVRSENARLMDCWICHR